MREQASVMFVNTEGEVCSTCGAEIPKDDAVVVWGDGVYDTLACYQEANDEYEKQISQDHIASRDQAVASVRDSLADEPRQFIFVFEPPGEKDVAITTTVFAHPEFVMSACAALVEGVALNEPTVAPPEED